MERLLNLIVSVVPGLVYLISNKLIDGSLILYSWSGLFYSLVLFIKKHSLLRFQQLVDICVIDRPTFLNRFGFVFIFLNLNNPFRLFINLFIKDGASIPSISSIFKNSI
jgi:NADH:ubiquinone oxidoreductase subunit C